MRWQETESGLESRLNDILIDRYAQGENAGYPTLCKGRFEAEVDGERKRYHALEEPTSLNTLSMLPELFAANVASVKIEGRQRSPAYVEQVTRTWREAIDMYQRNPEQYQVKPSWDSALANVSEGTQTTLGAYHRKWQ
ncbi:putative protease [Vibrio variabilis]|uniref:Protease n=1 Tax=Vibrio variabilis TaxID=990271 RepID=A0ABQ0J855_9VIBR|nr:putative protease [Vibrio variabilis]